MTMRLREEGKIYPEHLVLDASSAIKLMRSTNEAFEKTVDELARQNLLTPGSADYLKEKFDRLMDTMRQHIEFCVTRRARL